MPHIPPKKPVTADDFSWDTFPPPPPEAEDWQPNPDSIARPRDLPDPRFNRDPYEDVRKATFKKEAKMYNIPADVAASLKSGSPSPAVNGANPNCSGLGSWPTPIPRASGYPREVVDSVQPPPPSSSIRSSLSPNVSSKGAPIKPSTSSTPRVAPTAATNSVSLAESVLPAWAAPLEKALAEDTRKGHTQSVKTSNAYIPAHLRKKTKSTVDTVGLRLDPTAKIYEPRVDHHADASHSVLANTSAEIVVNEEDRLNDEALAWKMATTDLGINNAKQGLQIQEKMLSDFKGQPPSPTVAPAPTISSDRFRGNHGHWLKARLVMIMEDDLDLTKRATESELMAMTDNDIHQYIMKVSSAHEHWWEAEQRLRFDESYGSE